MTPGPDPQYRPGAPGLDEMVDGTGRLWPHGRGVLGAFTGLGPSGLAERGRWFDRAFQDEGIASVLPGAAGQPWRCDPLPLLLPAAEFAALEAGLAQRAGVCQDFAHVMVAGLRALGVPARHVSGYLRTRPPPGQPARHGADQSHAWVGAWMGPQYGWIDLDPTNDLVVHDEHVVLAWGRDYGDISISASFCVEPAAIWRVSV